MHKVRAVVFDLDGTLADSLPDIGMALNAVLKQHALAEFPLPRYREFIGEGAQALVRRAFAVAEGRKSDSVEVPKAGAMAVLCAEFRRSYESLDHRHSRLFEGIPELLDSLSNAKIPMAVLSNKPDDLSKSLIASHFSRWKFMVVRGSRANVPMKPDPQAALEIASLAGEAPSKMAFVGDSAIDMKTATAAGMIPLGVLWGFRPRDELARAGARRLFANPRALGQALLPASRG